MLAAGVCGGWRSLTVHQDLTFMNDDINDNLIPQAVLSLGENP